MFIYAFGSTCRGEIEPTSDVDMLAIVEGIDDRFNPNDYSIYSYERIQELWNEGNPFAWHLYLESKLIFSSTKIDFLKSLGEPKAYTNGINDCHKFYDILLSAIKSLNDSSYSEVFDLSSVFLSIRNFATCFSLQILDKPDFSRNSARRLGVYSLDVDKEIYKILQRSRILCTRSYGEIITSVEVERTKSCLIKIENWMIKLSDVMGRD